MVKLLILTGLIFLIAVLNKNKKINIVLSFLVALFVLPAFFNFIGLPFDHTVISNNKVKLSEEFFATSIYYHNTAKFYLGTIIFKLALFMFVYKIIKLIIVIFKSVRLIVIQKITNKFVSSEVLTSNIFFVNPTPRLTE